MVASTKVPDFQKQVTILRANTGGVDSVEIPSRKLNCSNLCTTWLHLICAHCSLATLENMRSEKRCLFEEEEEKLRCKNSDNSSLTVASSSSSRGCFSEVDLFSTLQEFPSQDFQK